MKNGNTSTAIEFQMKPTRSDFAKAAQARMWNTPWVRIWMLFSGIFLIACILIANYGPESTKNSAEAIGFLFFIALLFPPLTAQGAANRNFSVKPRIEDRVFVIDENGFGFNSPLVRVYFDWVMSRGIYETSGFFFIKAPKGCITIFKRHLSQESLITVKKILHDAPVKKKKLCSD